MRWWKRLTGRERELAEMILGAKDRSQERATKVAERRGQSEGHALATREMRNWDMWIRRDREMGIVTVGWVPDSPFVNVMWPVSSEQRAFTHSARDFLDRRIKTVRMQVVPMVCRNSDGAEIRWFNLEMVGEDKAKARPLWLRKFAELCYAAMAAKSEPEYQRFGALLADAHRTLGIEELWENGFQRVGAYQ